MVLSHVWDIESTARLVTNSIPDMLSGPIVAMVWEGRDATKTGRCKLLSLTRCL